MSSDAASAAPMLYCTVALAVPTVRSPGLTSPTGRLDAPTIGVSVVPLRMAKVIRALRMSPRQVSEMSWIVALRINVAVLLLGPVVQKNRAPVNTACPGSGVASSGVITNGVEPLAAADGQPWANAHCTV